MTSTAILSMPSNLAAQIGGVLSRGTIPIRSVHVAELDRTYLCIPLCLLADRSFLFDQPDVQIECFATPETAMRWGSADITRRTRIEKIRRLREVRAEREAAAE